MHVSVTQSLNGYSGRLPIKSNFHPNSPWGGVADLGKGLTLGRVYHHRGYVAIFVYTPQVCNPVKPSTIRNPRVIPCNHSP